MKETAGAVETSCGCGFGCASAGGASASVSAGACAGVGTSVGAGVSAVSCVHCAPLSHAVCGKVHPQRVGCVLIPLACMQVAAVGLNQVRQCEVTNAGVKVDHHLIRTVKRRHA
jgi:hypothetical protein